MHSRGRGVLGTAGEAPALPMTIETIRKFCMSLPHATEQVQWGGMLVFKIAKQKMFCLANLEPERDDVLLFFKATDEEFVELQEIEGIIPAPYMAKNKWVALERLDVLPATELERLLAKSYELVFARLPKKEQAKVIGEPSKKKHSPRRHRGTVKKLKQ